MIHYLICCILIIILPLPVAAQTVIEGRVLEAKGREPIEQMVVALVSGEGRMLKYQITRPDGRFHFVYDHQGDSLYLHFRHLSYESKKIPAEAQTGLEVLMNEQAVALREVSVGAPPILGKEDTVVYRVSAFKNQQDRSIEEVLKKMPGIEINTMGGITYNGTAINHLYIEGIDLLGGRYTLATKNISADQVTQVEVLESHQPVKMLRGVIPSTTPAINLKLKNNRMTRPAGTLSGSLGWEGEELLYGAEAFALKAQKGSQSVGLFKSNNLGRDLFTEFNSNDVSDGKPAKQFRPLLSPSDFTLSINRKRYLDNNSNLASINHLFKLNDDAQLKVNINYFNDRRESEQWQRIDYNWGDSVVLFREESKEHIRQNRLSGTAQYRKNGSTLFLVNDTKIDLGWSHSEARFRNPEEVSERRSIDEYDFVNRMRMTLKAGNRYLDFYSTLQYVKQPQQLAVTPYGDEASALQRVCRDGWYVDAGSYFMYLRSPSTFKVELNLQTAFEGISTRLSSPRPQEEAENRLRTNDVQISLNPIYSIELANRRLRINASVPLVWNKFNQIIGTFQPRTYRDFWFLNPRISVNYKMNSHWDMLGSYNLQHRTGGIEELMTGYVLTGYHNLMRSGGILSEGSNQTLLYNVKCRYPSSGFFGSLELMGSNRGSNLMSSQSFRDETPSVPESVTGVSLLQNKSQTYMGTLHLSKYIHPLRTTLVLNGNAGGMVTRREQFGVHTIRATQLEVNPRITSNPHRFLIVNYGASFSHNKTRMETLVLNGDYINRLRNTLGISLIPSSRYDLKIMAEHLVEKRKESQANRSFFLDMELNYRMKVVEFSLEMNNLLNARRYYNIFYRGLDRYENSYRLRERNVVFTTRVKY